MEVNNECWGFLRLWDYLVFIWHSLKERPSFTRLLRGILFLQEYTSFEQDVNFLGFFFI